MLHTYVEHMHDIVHLCLEVQINRVCTSIHMMFSSSHKNKCTKLQYLCTRTSKYNYKNTSANYNMDHTLVRNIMCGLISAKIKVQRSYVRLLSMRV